MRHIAPAALYRCLYSASAMQMWQWDAGHLQRATDPSGGKLYHSQRQGVTFPLADALCGWLLRAQILDVARTGKARPPTIPSQRRP